MRFNSFRWPLQASTWITAGLSIVAIALSAPSLANSLETDTTDATTAFPDTQNHWAQPFIERLAERDILTGYLDGTYRPEQLVNRDEFAAILSQAFNPNQERPLARGSVYSDVPADYWAAQAIEEVYEAGFMTGYPDGTFRPEQEVSRVEALVALAQNLDLGEDTPLAAAPAAQPTATTAQPATRQRAPRRYMYPIAMTTLMQPLMTAPTRARQAAIAPAPAVAQNLNRPPVEGAAVPLPIAERVSTYYSDAGDIPHYAIESVAATTNAGLVVNHPSPQVLNPTQPATRAEIAAFIHQALVDQGRLDALPNEVAATTYIVDDRQ